MGFVAEAALIGLREGLEAFLIVGILLGFLTRLYRPDGKKWVWIGFATGIAASLAVDIKFTLYATVFYNESAPAGFTAVPDA